MKLIITDLENFDIPVEGEHKQPQGKIQCQRNTVGRFKGLSGGTEVTEFGFHTDAVTKEEAEALNQALAGTICTGRAQEYQ